MTENEKEALRIIEPFLAEVLKFHRSRTLLGNHELRLKLAEANYALTNDEISTNKIKTSSCGSCSTKALDALYRLHKQSLSDGGTKPRTKESKPKRGRPRKQNKPTN